MPVLTELGTMMEATQGTSIARFGHGELAIMNGRHARHQKYEPQLAEELRTILRSSPCLVCVPHTRGKRAWEWQAFLEEYGRDIRPDRWYGSAFISRADEVDWSKGYEELALSLIRRGHLLASFGADDYARIDELEDAALAKREPVLLSCGPAATVLADRLARLGKWAVDIGNIRTFLNEGSP